MEDRVWVDMMNRISPLDKSTHHRVQTTQSSTNSQTAETTLRDRGVNDPLLTESIQQPLCDLVGTIVLSNLLAQDEDLGVGLQLLGQSLVQRISDCIFLDAVAVSICPDLRGASEVDGSGNGTRRLREGWSLCLDSRSSCCSSEASRRSEESRHCG